MNNQFRSQLSQLLANKDQLSSSVVMRSQAKITEVNTSFLRTWKIYQVDYLSPTKFIAFFVAAKFPDDAFLLTGNPESYVNIAKMDEVSIENEEQAREYIFLFFQTTRTMDFVFYFVETINQIDFIPNPDSEAKTRIEQLRQKYAEIIKPYQVAKKENGFEFSFYAIVGQDLMHYAGSLFPLGTLTIKNNDLIVQRLPICVSV